MPEDSRPEWDDVDDAAEAASGYLDTVTGLDAIRAGKERSYRLLGIGAGDRVLDVGCGVGDDVRALAGHVGAEGTVLGVDRSAALVAQARSRAGDAGAAGFQVGDATALGVAADAVDGCRADRVFQHLAAPRDALAEMCRVTRPGGRLTVTDPDWGTLVVDAAGVDPDLTARVTDTRWAVARQPTVGRRLHGLVRDAGCTEVTVDTATVALREFETAAEVFNLGDRVAAMQEAGAVGADAGEAWLAGLREAAAEDRLFAAMSGVTVGGTVPADAGRE